MKRLLPLWVVLGTVLASCASPSPQPTPLPITPTFIVIPSPTPIPVPIHLNLVWLLHQPLQGIDPDTGLFLRSTVRLSALRNYHALTQAAQRYPSVHTTANVSPVVARQIAALASGARDVMWELSVREAASLTAGERALIVDQFASQSFTIPSGEAPARYRELLDKRAQGAAAFSDQDILDAQVWHHLASFPPAQLATPPLNALIDKGRDFSEQDKQIVLEQVASTLRGLLPALRDLQNAGVIEITTSPLAHPILPLLMDPAVQQSVTSGITGQRPVFGHPEDGDEQLARARTLHESIFGRAPGGLWPAGGAVSPGILPAIQRAGFSWLIAGERALAGEIGERADAPLNRDEGGIPVQAGALYQPYLLSTGTDGSPPLVIVFGDTALSDALTMEAWQTPDLAAQRLVDQVLAIRERLSPSGTDAPPLVTLVLDVAGLSEAFFDPLYQRLAAEDKAGLIRTVTVPEHISQTPAAAQLASITAGAWNESYNVWAGHAEDIAAWNLLNQVREFLQGYLSGNKVTDGASISRAYEAALLAQSADWFEATGSDQPEEDREYIDNIFRDLLAQVYRAVGAPVPDYIKVPALQPSVAVQSQSPTGFITPTLNGFAEEGEWEESGLLAASNAILSAGAAISSVRFGLNTENLYFRIDTTADVVSFVNRPEAPEELRLGIYLQAPGASHIARFTRVDAENETRRALGFDATHLLEWTLRPDGSASVSLYQANANLGWSWVMPATGAARGPVVEMALPIQAISAPNSALDPDDIIVFAAVAHLGQRIVSRTPHTGIAQMNLASLSLSQRETPTFELTIDDPAGDDYGFGNYTYPTDPVFERGTFDFKRLRITQEGRDLVFKIDLHSPIANPWNSPTGLSLQTFDIYIDQDPGQGTGRRKLLEGRNASLPKAHGWEIALWIEGWHREALAPAAGDTITVLNRISPALKVDPLGTVTVRVSIDDMGGGDPAKWAFAVAVLSQDAFPARGVRRVRDIAPTASQWHLGGAPADTNHTRIIDIFTPPDSGITQETSLGAYSPTQTTDVSELDADQFGIVPMLTLTVE